jgi:hypothetical protein
MTMADGEQKIEERKVVYQPRTRRLKLHSCKIPEDAPGYTGEACPEPELDAGVEPEVIDLGQRVLQKLGR